MTALAVVPPTSSSPRDTRWGPILEIAAGLVGRGHAEERYPRIISGIKALIPCDSIVLLRLSGDTLWPVASSGLVPEVTSQRFEVAEHPRLAQILRARRVVRFTDDTLPDPFDGLIACGGSLRRVHACMGCTLEIEGEVVGVLAVDALDPRAFDDLDDDLVAAVAALSAAAIRGADLIERLEQEAARAGRVARDLLRDTAERAGGRLIGGSETTQKLRRDVDLAARSDLAVLITGETGVGKEVVARAIHAASSRAEEPLIYVNCAALPESIAVSELFGHVRGAFTGAIDHRAGKFEVADGGTLFLDEIGELPLSIQPKLLRALQSGEIQRVGSDKLLRVNVRIIAATNRDLSAEVAGGRFRADLYHRLSVYPIRVAPLRERRDDIGALAGTFLDEARVRLGLGSVRLSATARAALESFDWPGNVRELEHTILRAALRASGGRRRELVMIEDSHLDLPAAIVPISVGEEPPAPGQPRRSLQDLVEDTKRRAIAQAVEQARGNWAEAARLLQLDRANLHRLARRLGMHK
jgi:anaerobic nitric oxide reductase transcription regulator